MRALTTHTSNQFRERKKKKRKEKKRLKQVIKSQSKAEEKIT
jgi:hypothetical protein